MSNINRMLKSKHNKSLLLEQNILRHLYIIVIEVFDFNSFIYKIVFNILVVFNEEFYLD